MWTTVSNGSLYIIRLGKHWTTSSNFPICTYLATDAFVYLSILEYDVVDQFSSQSNFHFSSQYIYTYKIVSIYHYTEQIFHANYSPNKGVHQFGIMKHNSFIVFALLSFLHLHFFAALCFKCLQMVNDEVHEVPRIFRSTLQGSQSAFKSNLYS